jgi:uncharacterized membrane protein
MVSTSQAAGLAIPHVFAVLLVGSVVAPAAGAVGHPGTDNTVTHIALAADGDARWTVQIRTRLDSSESVRQYEQFQRSFRENGSAVADRFETRMRSIVDRASEQTGRRMALVNMTTETSIQAVPRRWGIVTFSFTWERFARTDGETVLVGDVFGDGFFIAANDTLEIAAPDGYEFAAVEPEPDSTETGTVSWTGREDFGQDRPSLRASPADGSTPLGGLGLLAALLPVALIVLGGALVWRRRAAGGETDAPAFVDDETLVIQTLEEAGGQLKQAELTAQVDWSKSKVSRVTGRLADQGAVEKIQIGRENVLRLPEDTED